MDSAIAKQLVDKIYEKRKAAALELEKQIRDCQQQRDERRISQIIDQLVDMFSNSSNALHVRNGGLIGLAGTAIALGVEVAPYMDKFIHQLLACFVDPENRIRYFSAECLYNIAKVSKGEVLVYFNEIFDALSKLAADSELSVRNGAELLDRLLKDIVAESASVYIPLYPETEKIRDEHEEARGVLVDYPDGKEGHRGMPGTKKAFSLAHFIPLLRERIYVVSPFTRTYLVSWITVLDSVPELELITYLPEFLDGLLRYLSDPTEDVRVTTEILLADFLREIQDVSNVRHRTEEQARRQSTDPAESLRQYDGAENGPDSPVENRAVTPSQQDRGAFLPDSDDQSTPRDTDSPAQLDDERDNGAWVPGQGVRIDYSAIVDILLSQLDGEHDEIQQSTALRWLAEFMTFAPEVMVPFTPRLVPAVLPNLAHHAPGIQTQAIRLNKLLMNAILNLPSPSSPSVPRFQGRTPASPSPTATTSRQPTTATRDSSSRDISSPEPPTDPPQPPTPAAANAPLPRSRGSGADISMTNMVGAVASRPFPTSDGANAAPASTPSRPHSPVSLKSQHTQAQAQSVVMAEEPDYFDYQGTVTELTVQFLSEFEETRVAALKWLIMLHQKAPKKILAMDDGTFPALLKTLSDSSDEVIKHDLQLLAQISSSSEETYFKAFMMNLLELFSTDRKLLETRGSLIIRQLCLNLNPDRIYRTFAEILEKEDDLEFASVIVQNLNMILITSPELTDFRKRLKSLETRQDGQALFTTLYRSWCHNAVSVFSLCLLAQAYEHASNLLYIFADLEITVPMLVQIDKLVQLIESPVFTYIRLQLLEPERYPHLFKCLYGLLMLLPQSTAFVSLRNRLNAVNSAGFLHIAPKSSISIPARSKVNRDREEIRWQELLQHFRTVQGKHEKARRLALGSDGSPFTSFLEAERYGDPSATSGGPSRPSTVTRPPMRRKVTGSPETATVNPQASPPAQQRGGGALSPLNPRARGQTGLLSSVMSSQSSQQSSGSGGQAAKPKRVPLNLGRK
ncbi:ARM repeat-containing protein [Schizophyllum commune H4-8]|uniref:ARM repeat-containing protein n=1 Tax=Schizophyllum commune (strain H4-8 / FGSC 9210) TaxID=578458 RepID=UPI00215FD4B3|nr:ARM repeat-containing protein [Schizophyllum commune H4-8]KAI5893997.1 ARM repeat-containing protein [Schizophyllum commune H4-8]